MVANGIGLWVGRCFRWGLLRVPTAGMFQHIPCHGWASRRQSAIGQLIFGRFTPLAWDQATQQFYGYQDLSDLQIAWIDWVRKGSLTQSPLNTLAAAGNPQTTQPSQGSEPTENQLSDGRLATGSPAMAGNVLEHSGSWYSQQSPSEASSNPQANSIGNHFVRQAESFLPGSTSLSTATSGTFEDASQTSIWR